MSEEVNHPWIVVVQAVTTRWTKRTRGALFAAQRRGIPLALPLPSRGEAPLDSFCLVDRVFYNDGDAFTEPVRFPLEEVKAQTLGGVFYQVDENVAIEPGEDAIKIDLRWTNGAPRRMHHVGLFTVRPGAWARIRYNYRRPTEDSWMYVQRTLNIALGADLGPKVFTVTDPVHNYEDIADLW
jgi:hypothetical protein